MNAAELFQKMSLQSQTLEGQLESEDREVFRREFKKLFGQPDARGGNGIVYVWHTALPVPRLRGTSNIVYIGQTIRNLGDRYLEYVRKETSGGNWQRYEHIVKNYGPIRVSYSICEDPKQTEATMLRKYFDEHLEFPPINRTSS